MKAKRMIAVLLLATLCFTMTACATGSSADVLGVTYPTTPLDTASGGSAAQSDDAIAAGEVYRNEYFNFTCNLSDEWYVLNADEVDQVIGTARDAMGEGDASDVIKKSLDDGTSTMDFYAVSGSGTQTINIVLGKGTLLQRFLTEKQLLEASIPLLSAGLENMGAKNITYTNETVTVLGKEHAATFVSAEYQGVSLGERIFLILKGSYLSTITITDMAGNSTDDALAYFQSIN
ncbi:MAG: hypothetical protein ABFC56_00745 [Clostridiaceae bacterium]